jgi:hypothetical protein
MNSDLLAKVALQITLDVRREPFAVDKDHPFALH